jgi:hypothetical protein
MRDKQANILYEREVTNHLKLLGSPCQFQTNFCSYDPSILMEPVFLCWPAVAMFFHSLFEQHDSNIGYDLNIQVSLNADFG